GSGRPRPRSRAPRTSAPPRRRTCRARPASGRRRPQPARSRRSPRPRGPRLPSGTPRASSRRLRQSPLARLALEFVPAATLPKLARAAARVATSASTLPKLAVATAFAAGRSAAAEREAGFAAGSGSRFAGGALAATRRDCAGAAAAGSAPASGAGFGGSARTTDSRAGCLALDGRSEEHTSELQSRENLVCRLLLE